jgi:hypothetical protein
MFRAGLIGALCAATVVLSPLPARAVLTSQDGTQTAARVSGRDMLQTHQYRWPESRAAGRESVRQAVTVWEVTAGTWNGQSLQGLSLVVVSSAADCDPCAATTSCYISHRASVAQRAALLGAFLAAQALSPEEAASWRLEPAVIQVEHAGGTVVVHVGLVA